jgi:hypothetical protein
MVGATMSNDTHGGGAVSFTMAVFDVSGG